MQIKKKKNPDFAIISVSGEKSNHKAFKMVTV